MNIEANEQELQALAGLLDAAVRNAGLRAVKDAAVWMEKIEAALSPPEKEEPDNASQS